MFCVMQSFSEICVICSNKNTHRKSGAVLWTYRYVTYSGTAEKGKSNIHNIQNGRPRFNSEIWLNLSPDIFISLSPKLELAILSPITFCPKCNIYNVKRIPGTTSRAMAGQKSNVFSYAGAEGASREIRQSAGVLHDDGDGNNDIPV